MSYVREHRQAVQDKAAAKASFVKIALGLCVALVAIGGAIGFGIKHLPLGKDASRPSVVPHEARRDSGKGDKGDMSIFEQAKALIVGGRGKKDGESAADFAAARCLVGVRLAEAASGLGVKPFGGIQSNFEPPAGQPKPDLKAACRSVSKDFVWRR